MTYAQIDDRFDEHPKYGELDWDLEHYGLQACAITYCNRHLTDGMLPRSAVAKFGKGRSKRNLALASLFVSTGVWRTTANGFEIVGFLDHNPSKEEIMSRRVDLSAARALAGRAGGLRSGESRRKQTGSKPEANPKQPPSGLLQQNEALSTPLRSDPIKEETPLPPTSRQLALAYAEAIGRGACIAISVPSSQAEFDKLTQAVAVHARGEPDPVAWIDRQAEAFTQASTDPFIRTKGFPVWAFLQWLNGRNVKPASKPNLQPPAKGAPSWMDRNPDVFRVSAAGAAGKDPP